MRLGQQAACQTGNVSQTHIAPWGDFGPLLEESRLEMTHRSYSEGDGVHATDTALNPGISRAYRTHSQPPLREGL